MLAALALSGLLAPTTAGVVVEASPASDAVTRALSATPAPAPAMLRAGSRPNIVVVMTDQQKATAIDLYGGPVRTPNLGRLAADGLLYEHAFTPHPLCVPARVSFWTGRWLRFCG